MRSVTYVWAFGNFVASVLDLLKLHLVKAGKVMQKKIRIMSHNIWCGPCGSPDGNVYGRDKALAELFEKYSPDVLSLQEMTPGMYKSDIEKYTSVNFEWLKPDTDGLTNNTPILIKKGVFDVLEQGWHLFSGLNNSATKSVSWAVLKIKSSGDVIGVCSNHFWWEEDGAENDMARIGDARQQQAFVDYIKTKYNAPVFSMGDLNCAIGSNPYNEMIKNAGIDARLCAVSHCDRMNTLHEYPVLDEKCFYRDGQAPLGSHLDAIDHIIVYGYDKVTVDGFYVVSEQKALDVSDHCPVYIDAYIK